MSTESIITDLIKKLESLTTTSSLVELLYQTIEAIQEECKHEWEIENIDPKELKEQSARVVKRDGKEQTIHDLTWVVKYEIVCLKCQTEKTVNLAELCPFCLRGEVTKLEEIDEARWGFGQYSDRTLEICQCNNCETKIFNWCYTT